MKHLLLILAVGLVGCKPSGELFKGESSLKACEVTVPMTYKKKDDVELMKVAKDLNEQPLVYLSWINASNIRYLRCKLIVEGEDVFLVNKKTGKHEYYPVNQKKERFYTAECFDSVLKKDQELKAALKEE